jgi:SAM-dependent methyltransferase
MPSRPALAPRRSSAFDERAEEYDRVRPRYPRALVARACELAGLASGDEVLEVGCGSGQLTRDLVARGLHVVAVEPGRRLLSLAERNLRGAGSVDFVRARFEEARLSRGRFQAVFSAAAFHWIDPKVSWRKAAEVLAPDGTLALIQHFGLADRRSSADHEALLGAIARVAPKAAAEWPSYRGLRATVAGVRQRRRNVSEAWAWLGGYELAEACAGRLFGTVRMAAMPVARENDPDELDALLRTLSFHGRLTPGQGRALRDEVARLHRRLGRPVRSCTLAVALVARRSASRSSTASPAPTAVS